MFVTRKVAALYHSAGARAAVALTTLGLASGAHAAGEFDAVLDAVDLSGIATKIGALALVVVTVALIFKGPDLAKRIIRKV
ncbi:hypothetical protein J2X19_002316 [Rhodoferax ferrireducens]|uniref:Phage coat protein n=1 Tax=Rhodoferax ferrireducens TaxID=192843 RepID=A0ABU2C8H7_9BURK|nr:hypothetical protein [Rhodoferax ferrireducens]MDR7377637.1 hypothetical protein [Rhodoferax ferrireducens]